MANPVSAPDPQLVVSATAVPYAAADPIGTAKTVVVPLARQRSANGYLHVFVKNPSTAADLQVKLQDDDGAGNWHDRQTYSGISPVAVNHGTAGSFLFDGGVGPSGSRLTLTTTTAVVEAGGMSVTVSAWSA